MFDLQTQAQLSRAWSDMAFGCMSAAMAQSMANMEAATKLWSSAPGLSTPFQSRSATSTAKPWYRAPDPAPFEPFGWMTMMGAPTRAMGTPPMFGSPAVWWATQPGYGVASQGYRSDAFGAAVPSLLALVALGAMAQQALGAIDVARHWQRVLPHTPASLHPTYRSDGGHATAAVVLPGADLDVVHPMAGLAFTLRMLGLMPAR